MEIKIVEYNHDLAAEVADMWNHSREGWGGGNDISTAESIRQKEENSINLNTYLAVEDHRVLGYCGMSEYREDVGALYIALLNVRDDLHGKKIGKHLVLKAIERTIELGWPRLDLYTWGGNTKAVPLYKKCGFFWEERDDTVHLMNFIPSVLSTELVKEYFQEVDWYVDSKREIEVKPDGRKENGFDFYEYKWEKNENFLRMEYERKGRGLRLIESNDYLISMSIEQQELIFGSEYPVFFHITNKTSKPLEISIEGFHDQNIQFEMNQQITVMDSVLIEERFFVGNIEEEQSIWRTHPTVAVKVMINGKKAIFKLGIHCKYPARFVAKLSNEISYLEMESEAFLEIENHYDEDVQISFTLPEASYIEFLDRQFQIAYQAKERKLIPISFLLKDYGFYSPQVEINVTKKSGGNFQFKKRIELVFRGIGAKLFGESEEFWHIYNGLAHAYLSKFNNRLYFGRAGYSDGDPFYFYPKFGKPFSSEFSKKRPDKVEFLEEGASISLIAIYQSDTYKNLKLHSISKIYADGLMEHYYEIYNHSNEDTSSEIWLNDSNSFVHTLYEAILPYNGQLIEITNQMDGMLAYWDSEKVDENWIFNTHPTLPGGFCWSGDEKVNLFQWYLFFEHNLRIIPGHGVARTKPTYISMGAFQTLETFRVFAQKNTKINKELILSQPIQFYHNHSNPFVTDQTVAYYKDLKQSYFDGELTLLVGEKMVDRQSLIESDEKKEAIFHLNLENEPCIQTLQLESNLKLGASQYRSLLIRMKDESIQMNQFEENGITVYQVNNGEVHIKAAPEFFPALFSLQHNGLDWLDSTFPKLQPKSWWNIWPGGIRNSLLNMTNLSLLKEKSSADFVMIQDQKGNSWQGIKLQTEINVHEVYKGLTFNQYYLLLPGVPVLCHTTEIIQNTNRIFQNESWASVAALNHKLAPEQHGSIEYGSNREIAYFGKGENEIDVKESLFMKGSFNSGLQIISDYRTIKSELIMNKEVVHHTTYSKLNLKHGEKYWTIPVFYLFNHTSIPEDALHDLKSIRFH